MGTIDPTSLTVPPPLQVPPHNYWDYFTHIVQQFGCLLCNLKQPPSNRSLLASSTKSGIGEFGPQSMLSQLVLFFEYNLMGFDSFGSIYILGKEN